MIARHDMMTHDLRELKLELNISVVAIFFPDSVKTEVKDGFMKHRGQQKISV
jgi:hypothetical protein